MRILITDCGSTTTKALLFEETSHGWRTIARGEAPTTVEDPVSDVTVGVENAVRAIEEQTSRKLMRNSADPKPFLAQEGSDGIGLYLSTSSAGGGLQMLVLGVVPQFSAESASQAALRAGAIVREVITFGTSVTEFEHIARLREERPDIVILAGGIERGDTARVIELAELLRAANPKPRFGETRSLPVLFAGNSEAYPVVREILSAICEVRQVANVRPQLHEDNIIPARDEIHEVFLSHVMSHAPGYAKLLGWADQPIVPTPSACSAMIENLAEERKQNILCVDIGGATTDIFTCMFGEQGERIFHRSVSANYGMSFSIGNVLKSAGTKNIQRWLPFPIKESDLRNALKNKMIRPSTIPETIEELLIEQATCREALRLSLEHHNQLATTKTGQSKRKGIVDIFRQQNLDNHVVQRYGVDVVIGSGGVLSHAPNRIDAALMLLDGFQLRGCYSLAVDSVFMLPHLGALAKTNQKAAQEIFYADCLIPVACAVVPQSKGTVRMGKIVARVFIEGTEVAQVRAGELTTIKTAEKGSFMLTVTPEGRNISVGVKPGESVTKQMLPAPEGILLDGRQCVTRKKKEPR